MKKNNKLFAAAFAIVFGLTATVPGMQAQAAYMSTFTPQNTSSYSTKLTAGLQTFLLNYSKDTKEYIRDNGMVDGQYGKATYEAVKIFQGNVNIKSDGMCGKNTWTHIENYVLKSLFDIHGDWYFYKLHATYYNSGKSLAQRTSDKLWRGYYEGSGSISSIKLGWHDIG